MRINEYVPDSSVFDFNKSVQDNKLNSNNTVSNNSGSTINNGSGNTVNNDLDNTIWSNDKTDINTDENDSSISDFASMLKNKLDEVNDQQVQADNSTEELIAGDRTDIHNVMLDTEQAKMSLELAVQIRNKLVDAYQELNRTQL